VPPNQALPPAPGTQSLDFAVRTRQLLGAYPAAPNPGCVPGSSQPQVRTRQLAYPAAPNPSCVPGSAYPAALRTRQSKKERLDRMYST